MGNREHNNPLRCRAIVVDQSQHFALLLSNTGVMFVVTGDETGLVKAVDVSGRTFLRYGDQQSRSLAITGLTSPSPSHVASINHQGALHTYTVDKSDGTVALIHKSQYSATIDKPSGMRNVVINGKPNGKVLLYNADGAASIFNTLTMTPVASFSVKGPVAAAATCNGAGALFGGRENDARFVDLSTQQETWTAKNVSQDKLHLRVPVWITSMAFRDSLADSYNADSAASGNGTVFYTGTAYRHVRMYDMNASRQPVCSFEVGADYRVASILPARGSDSDRLLYVADTVGGLTLWDMRTVRRLATLKGAAGSIRQMTLSADGQRLACVGLDRFLRVYDTADNSLVSSVYLKNRLNTCLFLDGLSDGSKALRREKAGSTGRRAKGSAVQNEADEDELQELNADSSDEDEAGSEGEDEDDSAGVGEASSASDAEEEGSGEDEDQEGEEEEEEEHDDDGDSEEESEDQDDDQDDDQDEDSGASASDSEEDSEAEVQVKATAGKHGASKAKAAPAGGVSKRARR